MSKESASTDSASAQGTIFRLTDPTHSVAQVSLARIAATLVCVVSVLTLSAGPLRLWQHDGFVVTPPTRYLLLASVGVIGWLVLRTLRGHPRPALSTLSDPRIWTIGLALLVLTDWIGRPYTLFSGALIRGELVLGAAGVWLLLNGPWRGTVTLLPLASSALLICSFLAVVNGSLLLSDDHAVFFFRLQLLKENFPHIPFWSPLWNAGFDARDFFATGALNAFFLASPLLYTFPLESVYNLTVALLLWGLVPACSYGAARLFGFHRSSASIAAVLAVASSLSWYRWALTYGTMGFIVSTALLPLCVALTLRFISDTSMRSRELLLFVAAVSLMLMWSLSGAALIPLALLAIPRLPQILRSRRKFFAILALLCINLPILTILWNVSSVGRFLHADQPADTKISSAHSEASAATPVSATASPTNQRATATAHPSGSPSPARNSFRHRAGGIDWHHGLRVWRESANSLNPLILALLVPALLTLPRGTRLALTSLCSWQLLLGTLGVSLKPQLELDRMVVIAAVLACVPTARFIDNLFARAHQGTSYRLAGALVGSFLILSPAAVSGIIHNRASDKFSLAQPIINNISAAIKRHARGGRAVFTGCVLHQLSGAHLAPLVFWADTPMVASSYAHNIWHYEQPVPKSYLARGATGTQEFFDHINATLVIAHESQRKHELADQPHLFREVWREEPFVAFERIGYNPSYILQGDASELIQRTNAVTITPQSDHIVIKFKYFPFLTTSQPGCTTHPFKVAPELDLLELRGCPIGKPVTISSVSAWDRITQQQERAP